MTVAGRRVAGGASARPDRAPRHLSGPRVAAAFTGRERTVPDLPATLVPADVRATEAGVTLHARADDVRVA